MAKSRILISEDSLDQSLGCKGLLFDTNVWLRVQGYYTDSRDKRSRTYSWFYKKALERECPIFLPSPVLSEFVGVSLNAKARESGWNREQGKIHKCASGGGIDFNDLLISEICKLHGLVLVTDDADMKDQEVDIVTANAGLLA